MKLLIIEESREPERSLFIEEGARLGIEVEHRDAWFAELGIVGGRVSSGVDARKFDALALRSYRRFAALRVLAEEFHGRGLPVLGLDPRHAGFAQDKLSDLVELARAGVAVPDTWGEPGDAPALMVAKENWGQGGYGVSLVRPGESRAFESPQNMHFQEFIEAPSDWRILLCQGRALPWAVERVATGGEFRTNTHQGGSPAARCLAQVEGGEAMARLAEAAGAVLGRPCAGVDMRAAPGGQLKVLEVNRCPRLRLGSHARAVVGAYLTAWAQEVAAARGR